MSLGTQPSFSYFNYCRKRFEVRQCKNKIPGKDFLSTELPFANLCCFSNLYFFLGLLMYLFIGKGKQLQLKIIH